MMNNDHETTHDDNTMPTGPLNSADDPRMLAFLLGELEDADRTHVETFLANTPHAEAELDDLRSMLGLLETEIAADGPAPKLHTSQRDEIVAASQTPVNEVAKASSAGGSSGVWLRMAAMVAATAGLGWLALDTLDVFEDRSTDMAPEADVALYDMSPQGRVSERKAGDDTYDDLSSHDAADQERVDELLAKNSSEEGVRQLLEKVGYVDKEVPESLRTLGYTPALPESSAADTALQRRSFTRSLSAREKRKKDDAFVGTPLESLGYVDSGDQVVTVGGAAGGRGGNGHPSSYTPGDAVTPGDAYTVPETLASGGPAGFEFNNGDADGEQGGYGVVQLTDGASGPAVAQDDAMPVESKSPAGSAAPAPSTSPVTKTALGEASNLEVGAVVVDADPSVTVDAVMGGQPLVTPEALNAERKRLADMATALEAKARFEAPMADMLRALGYVDEDADDTFDTGSVPVDSGTELTDEQRVRLVDLGYLSTDELGALSGRGRKVDGRVDPRWQFDRVRTRSIQREGYAPVHENSFVSPRDPQHARSTFGLDVDTASYANMRRFLNDGRMPPPDAIRIEELVNYFDYETKWADEAFSDDGAPIALRVEGAWAPWSVGHRLVRLSMKAVEPNERPPANIVFLVDVSGSMKPADRLPLLKSSMRLLVSTLQANDRVAIVTYNDTSGTTLESTTCDRKDIILAALDSLHAGGSTNGEAGLRQAYKVASQHFIEGGVNRVILASDGDFNVGAQTRDELYGLITQQAQSNVFLTVLGFGTDNLQDSNLELLADKGNGHYAYIDSLAEGEKVLMKEAGSTLQTVAKDVKIQVEFNPAKVQAYRLLGYENRALAAKDFNDDRKDAGDVGAGHTVTALYEIVPAGVEWAPEVDDLKYQTPAAKIEPDVELSDSPEMLTAKLRYKRPDSDTSELMVVPFVDQIIMFNATNLYDMLGMDDDFRLAAAAAQFGMVMRGSVHAGDASFDSIVALAESIRSPDPRGYRAEFIRMVKMAKGLSAR